MSLTEQHPPSPAKLSIAAVSWLLIWRWRIDVIWLILGSAIFGLVGQLAQSHR